MAQVAVFIDGGYWSKVVERFSPRDPATGKVLYTRVDLRKLAQWACQGDTLFRAYFYDCLPYQSSTPTPEESKRHAAKQKFFTALRGFDRFSVREGRLEYLGTDDRGNPVFVQKRVDLQLGLDIASTVIKGKVDVIAVVSGDSDLIPAVEFARQEQAIVRLVHGPWDTYHQDLWRSVDERLEITATVLKSLAP